MASAASPTPAGSSSNSYYHPAAAAVLTRKSSLRSSGLRRAPSRSQLERAESNPLPSAHGSKSQYAVNDSSDDEIPVPMKLSALTKALLNDEGAEPEREHDRVRTRARGHRPPSPAHAEPEKPIKRRSVLSSSTSVGEERRQHTRASSAQTSSRPTSPVKSQPSRESSPVRKRVVRLSSTSGTIATAATAAQAKPAKRRSTSTSLSHSQSRNRPPSRDSVAEDMANASEIKDKDINTPAQQGRVVRIAMSSSGSRVRSSGSSALSSSRHADSASFLSHAGQADEDGAPEAPQTMPRDKGSSNPGSASRMGSNGARSRIDESQGVQSAMRVKRVGKVPGSFLSGPARRGRRRQSEEDAENEREPLHSGQDADGQQPRDPADYELGDNLASSYYVPDRLASGSPVSSRSSTRPSHRREPSTAVDDARVPQSRQASPDHDEIPIPHYRIPPPRPEMPARNDQENEAPPTFRRPKPSTSSLLEREIPKAPPPRPLGADVGALRPTSPERKALGSLNQNTPRRAAPPPPPKMSILDAATSAAGAATAGKRRNYMKVNGKCYTRLDSLGRGGSGKVYRVAADNGKMFALKRVSLEGADENTVRGYKGEIDLLKKLNNVERVITLYDYEMNEEKQVLSLLMEMGELDLNTLLRLRLSPENARFDPVFVRYYWQEMLECLAAVHAHDIVHSDLKPANFVLVQGRLKLIDFGIANAIQTDETVNVHRETQIGTPNYMSPESLIDSNAADPRHHRIGAGAGSLARPKLMKLGKPSDIWSLGCILYQMVYGTPPFGHIANPMARCHAIINWQYEIEFRDRGAGGQPVPPSLLRTMRRCLSRDQHARPTCAELLSRADPFLHPAEAPDGGLGLPVTEDLLGRIVQSVVARCRERMPTEAEALGVWPQAYWASIMKAVGREGVGGAAPPSSRAGPTDGAGR
ncbi:kinase-like protein [Durotheca rogersii]|uniref:kinase-like protein n=1 Tax=Durotheca rogersii TaxID=419775 RepID=UPI00221F22CB|nr:kinase-like protein [Durotheca rogersii]KAI5862651.1 kinase-like protein [Durotheca rogersii]